MKIYRIEYEVNASAFPDYFGLSQAGYGLGWVERELQFNDLDEAFIWIHNQSQNDGYRNIHLTILDRQ